MTGEFKEEDIDSVSDEETSDEEDVDEDGIERKDDDLDIEG